MNPPRLAAARSSQLSRRSSRCGYGPSAIPGRRTAVSDIELPQQQPPEGAVQLEACWLPAVVEAHEHACAEVLGAHFAGQGQFELENLLQRGDPLLVARIDRDRAAARATQRRSGQLQRSPG